MSIPKCAAAPRATSGRGSAVRGGRRSAARGTASVEYGVRAPGLRLPFHCIPTDGTTDAWTGPRAREASRLGLCGPGRLDSIREVCLCEVWASGMGSSLLLYCIGARAATLPAAPQHRVAQHRRIAALRLSASLRGRCGQYRYCTRCTLLHRCANRCASAASRTQAPHDVAALPPHRCRTDKGHRLHLLVGRDGGQQAPEAARDA